MSVAATSLRHSRAAALLAAALVVAGAFAAYSLPSSIYPPLQFPRIVIIAKSGTLPPQSMMLIVTRPLEQAALEVPGIRRVRSRSIRGATEISAQFDPTTDMVVALQMVQNRIAEARGELPADTQLTVERMTPAVFPVFILALTGSLPTAELNDYSLYVMRPALARVPHAVVQGSELERERGKLVWSYDLTTPKSKNITEVQVDAITGKVVGVNVETPKDQAKEAAADRKSGAADKH